MSSKKILVILGVTGQQGGSVVKTILNDPAASREYQIRALTRDPSKPVALALIEQGVEIVKADLDDKSSLRGAFQDAYAVFAMTNFMDHFSKDNEIQQGKNVADICKELSIQHLIWSTLPHVSKITDGKITGVLHFDGKAIVSEYIRELGIPATHLMLGVFFNYTAFLQQPIPNVTPTKYKIAVPAPITSSLPLISVVEDTGKYVLAILRNRSSVLGKDIFAAQADYTVAEIIDIIQEETGRDVSFYEISDAEYVAGMIARGLPDFFAEDMRQNFKYMKECGFFPGQSVEESHQVLGADVQQLETYRDWVKKGGLGEN